MLITTCTHCLARFRVTPEQLNARQGQVRCGRCRKVFNGFEALERYPDDDTGARLLAAREAALKKEETLQDIEALPVDAPEASTAKEARPVAPPGKEAAPAAEAPRASRGTQKPGATAVHEPPPRERKPPARAWRFGVALLLLVLAGEMAFATRAALAQRYPILRPWLESVCNAVGCTVPWARDEASLKLEDSELLEIPGKANEIALGARIRNLGRVAQEYPHLEVSLSDFTGQVAARRVLKPADYMGRPVGPGEVLPAGGELAIQLRLETRSIKATGYELLLFYP